MRKSGSEFILKKITGRKIFQNFWKFLEIFGNFLLTNWISRLYSFVPVQADSVIGTFTGALTMANTQYYIDPRDSLDRCPCAKCGGLPFFARCSAGGWVGFCPNCELSVGFRELNPRWFRKTKDEAVYFWSGRQLVQKVMSEVAK